MTMIAGMALALFLVAMVVILVLLTNPPNKWVQRMGREDRDAESGKKGNSRE